MCRDVVWSFVASVLSLVLLTTADTVFAADLPTASHRTMGVAEQGTSAYAPKVFDRVKAVPKKQLLRRHRLELTPHAGLSVNDGFYEHFSLGGSAVFYPHDTFGIGLGANYLYSHVQVPTIDEMREAFIAARAPMSLPKLFAHLDVYWTPLYGKVSLPRGGIAQFDTYVSAGAGVMSVFERRNPPIVNVAIGQHYVINSWLALRLEVRDYIYLDRQRANNIPRSSVQNYVMLNAGLSFFVPPTFEYTHL